MPPSRNTHRRNAGHQGARQKLDTSTISLSSFRAAAQATRTNKACDECRKQKTRCLPQADPSAGCSRCLYLRILCSFRIGNAPSAPTSQSERIEQIYRGVEEALILLRLRTNSGNQDNFRNNGGALTGNTITGNSAAGNTTARNAPGTNPVSSLLSENLSTVDAAEPSHDFHHPSRTFLSSPFSIISKQIDTRGVPSAVRHLTGSHLEASRQDDVRDIISLNMLSAAEAEELLHDFKQNYGRWVLFPTNITTKELVTKIRLKCPLLLTTCCCIALRYLLNQIAADDIEAQNVVKHRNYTLLTQLAHELKEALLEPFVLPDYASLSGAVEFLQAIAVLSIYAHSLSSLAESSNGAMYSSRLANFSLDPWMLLNIGLSTFLSKSTFGSLIQHQQRDAASSPFTMMFQTLDDQEQSLTVLRIYNHLTIVHLIHCVFSGRPCVLDEVRLNYCTATLNLAKLTNFDGRVVSEIEVLLIAYNYTQIVTGIDDKVSESRREAYEATLEEMKQWHDQWEYLFSQPTVQFVLLCYHFCNIMIIIAYGQRESIKQNSAKEYDDIQYATSLPLILKTVYVEDYEDLQEHCRKLLLFGESIDNDVYFACLSDQIHFCFYFTAVLLIRMHHDLLDRDPDIILPIVWDETIMHIHNLIALFTRVSRGMKEDILTKYCNGIQQCLDEMESSVAAQAEVG